MDNNQISINQAMFAWNERTKKIKIIKHPDNNGLFNYYKVDSDIGASYHDWIFKSTEEQIQKFINMAFELIIKYDFNVNHINQELSVIPELRPYLKSE